MLQSTLMRLGAVVQFTPSSLSCRSLYCHRAAIASVKRETVVKTYPTMLVLPDGATIRVRYSTPRRIVKLPITLENATKEDIRRIKYLRRPRESREKSEEINLVFDPLAYLKK